jgi:hypothetical protein
MTDEQRNYLINRWLWVKLAGPAFGNVAPTNMEGDGRKQKRCLRELIGAGYLRQEDTEYHATAQAYDELPEEPWDIISVWESQNKDRRRPLNWVLWEPLSLARRKWCLEHPDLFAFYLVSDQITCFQHEGNERAVVGPFPLNEYLARLDAAKKARTTLDVVRFPTFELGLSDDRLAQHIAQKTTAETFERLFRNNLAWGLQHLQVLTEDEAKPIKSSDEMDGLFGRGWGNLGDEPE